MIGVEPDELGNGVGDDPETAGVGFAEVLPELVSGFGAVPEPLGAGLDDWVVSVEFGLGDDLGVGAAECLDEDPVTQGAGTGVVDTGGAEAADSAELKLQQEPVAVVVDQYRGVEGRAGPGGVSGTVSVGWFGARNGFSACGRSHMKWPPSGRTGPMTSSSLVLGEQA
ncbi:MAG: hypothetical protein ACRDQ4_03490 [Pseudonocardiaceae bacterium]